jgi:serine/threonine protein kinase
MGIEVGSRLGKYEILSLVGKGGMGEVYRARDPKLGRDVAIKVLPAAFSADADRLRRFEQEARAAGALNHPNILSIHDVDAHDGAPYIVSELLEGVTLREHMSGRRLKLVEVLDVAIQSAATVSSAEFITAKVRTHKKAFAAALAVAVALALRLVARRPCARRRAPNLDHRDLVLIQNFR